MTDPNVSRTLNMQSEETAVASNKKNRFVAPIVSFVAGLAVAGIIAGGLAVASPNETASGNNAAGNASVADQQVADSCSTTFDVVASVNQ